MWLRGEYEPARERGTDDAIRDITKAEGDKIAAVNLAAAAAIMEQTPGAMKLRTLQTVDGLGAGPSNTVVMFPIELTETVKKLVESLPQKNGDPPVVQS